MADKTTEQLTDDPTPFSSKFGWPLLSNRDPNIDLDSVSSTPFSKMLNLPLLSQARTTQAELKTDDPAPFSRMLNLPLLSGRSGNVELKTDDPTPLSRALNMPLLSDRETVAGGEVSGTRSGTPDNAFSRFIRQIITGEVQK